MKKNVLALSITAALVGFAGGAHAIVTPGGATGDGLVENRNGTGQILIVPYYSAQGSNATLLNLVNTDTTNGKAVKVRFRGAANSDDVFDFQVFLSPGDVYSAKVSQDATSKLAMIDSGGDTTCVKPDATSAGGTVSGQKFVTARLDPLLTGDKLAAGTREGYVEILNMADIPPTTSTTTSLYYAIKHVKGTPPCITTPTISGWTALDGSTDGTDPISDVSAAAGMGLTPPTGGIMANWTIMNTASAMAFAGQATALQTLNGQKGNVVYFPQTGFPVATPNVYTADPLLVGGYLGMGDTGVGVTAVAATITAAYYDLPDLSTPYTLVGGTSTPVGSASSPIAAALGTGAYWYSGDGSKVNAFYSPLSGAATYQGPDSQAARLTASIATAAIVNEYITEPTLNAATDWVFSMPTRRYSTAYDYNNGSTGTQLFTALPGSQFFVTSNTSVSGRVICVKGVSITPKSWNREEDTPAGSTGTVISPSTPNNPAAYCGEAGVLSVNVTNPTVSSVLGATVAVRGLLANNGAYANGWARLGTPGINNQGLPILGGAFTKATGPAASPFILGATWEHRYVRTQASNTGN